MQSLPDRRRDDPRVALIAQKLDLHIEQCTKDKVETHGRFDKLEVRLDSIGGKILLATGFVSAVVAISGYQGIISFAKHVLGAP